MFHSNTERLIGYWTSLKVDDRAPLRRAFDPAMVAELLPQVFMLEFASGALPVRLAGEFLIDLHGRPLKGVDFQDLFSDGGRRVVTQASLVVLNSPEPVVLEAEGFSEDDRVVQMEILLAPLAGEDGRPERLLGLYQPTSLVARLAGKPVVELQARLPMTSEGRVSHLKLAAVDGLRIA